MQTTLALASLVAVVAAQGVTETITPGVAAPAGCSASFSGDFEITAINSTIIKSKRSLEKRTCGAPGSLTINLNDGVLKDAQARTGYIASNFQFQFDGPAQAGAIFTGGFSACSNGSLALGGSAIFYECLSGDFFNLYDRSWAPQCQPILIELLPCGKATGSVGQGGDGQVTGTSVGAVTAAPDGQPQGTNVPVVTQINDGQPQAASAIPITQIADGQPQIPTALISQIAVPVTQITDGQIQAPTSAPAPITVISDGQPQAPVTTLAPVVSKPTGAPITQISDGQIQAPNATAPATTPIASTVPVSGGSLIAVGSSVAAAAAGIAALLLL